MPLTHVDRLVDHLTDGGAADGADALATDLRAWIEESRRFRAFAERHRDKIRKKIKATRGAEPRLDLRTELAVAHALLGDRRLELAYEGYGSTVGGPDFTVSFRSHVAFNLEVTRWRGDARTLERQTLAKHRQLPPSVANAILLAVDSADLPDAADVVRVLHDHADRGDDAYFARGGLAGARDFHVRHQRLGGIISWAVSAHGEARVSLWVNPSARISLPHPAAKALLNALRAVQ